MESPDSFFNHRWLCRNLPRTKKEGGPPYTAKWETTLVKNYIFHILRSIGIYKAYRVNKTTTNCQLYR